MLSLCLTNYNRYEMLIESFQHVYNDPRITEIVISDDCSKPEIWNRLAEYCRTLPKILLSRNGQNLGMSRNKAKAVELAKNPWCILGDSDNVFKPDYLDALEAQMKRQALDPMFIYCPDFAYPEFDYRKYSASTFSAMHLPNLNDKMLNCLFNTCNYVVNGKKYLEVYKYDPNIKASDTIHFNYLWLDAGYCFYVVPGMQYFHRVHSGSGFLADVNYNMQQAEKTKRMIMQL